jgi:putative DNA primase/helicase
MLSLTPPESAKVKLSADEIGADRDQFEVISFLRFDDEAQAIFDEWRMKLEGRLRSTDLHPALESHLAKYRKLVPSPALICSVADGGTRAIDGASVLRALANAEYLESHARRCYAAGSEAETASAKAILSRIRKGDLVDGFTCRDVHRQGWSNLSEPEQVQSGLDLLVDYNWLASELIAAGTAGGRPKTVYRISPRANQ